MWARTKAFSLTVDTLLALTLASGTPFGYALRQAQGIAQDRPTTAFICASVAIVVYLRWAHISTFHYRTFLRTRQLVGVFGQKMRFALLVWATAPPQQVAASGISAFGKKCPVANLHFKNQEVNNANDYQAN